MRGRLKRWFCRLPGRIVCWLLGIPGRLVQRLIKQAASLRAWVGRANWRSCLWWARLLLILAVAGCALFGVLTALPWWVGVVLLVISVLALSKSVANTTGHAIGATIAGIVALAGVNLVVDKVFSWLGFEMPIVPGLLFATLVFALAARRYLKFAEWPGPSTADVAVLLAIAVIIGLPVVVGLVTHKSAAHVPAPSSTAPKVDVLIITNGRSGAKSALSVASEPTLSGFDVRYSVGVAVGDRVRWTLSEDEDPKQALEMLARGASAPTSTRQPSLRAGANAVVLLDVDRTPPVAIRPEALTNVAGRRGEVSRWRRIATAAAITPSSGPIPTFALLQTNSPGRLASWQRFMPKGGVLSRQAQTHTSVTAIGLAMAVGAPSADADYALALRFRPILLFDSREQVPRPLSVNWLFEKRRVQLCKDGGAETDCTDAGSPSQLKSGGTHLNLRLPSSEELQRAASRDARAVVVQAGAGSALEPMTSSGHTGAAPLGARELVSPSTPDRVRGGADTAIYVHPVADEHNGTQLLYLDYWWYLSDNPSGVGGGAFCGAGMVIPGITCENHVSDWEGMTVVVDRTGAHPFIKSVHYAEHKDVVAYEWLQLRKAWKTDSRVPGFVRAVPGYAERPLVFIARGTHAAYAQPCESECRQVALDLGEGEHDGRLPWIGDYTATCGATSCVQVLPTYENGNHPALWNAFTGTWGDRHCVLTYYCDLTTPPTAPGQQGRYAHPSHCTGIVNSSWEFESDDQCEA